jgi:hypothetical protein
MRRKFNYTEPTESVNADNDDDIDDGADAGNTEVPDEEVYHPDTMNPSVQREYGLRPMEPMDYIHMHATVVHHAMTQYSF